MSASVLLAVIVTLVPGATLFPLGVLVIIGVVGAEFAIVKLFSAQEEYAPAISLARTRTVCVPTE